MCCAMAVVYTRIPYYVIILGNTFWGGIKLTLPWQAASTDREAVPPAGAHRVTGKGVPWRTDRTPSRPF